MSYSLYLRNPYVHVVTPVLAAMLMNAFIYSSGFKYKNMNVKGLPPGYVIGIVWMILFGMLGYAHYILYRQRNRLSRGCMALEALFVFSLMYPILTGLQVNAGKVLNLLSLVFGFVTGGFVMTESLKAAYYVVPYLVWTFYVNLVFVSQSSFLK